jgi:guanylate kinase
VKRAAVGVTPMYVFIRPPSIEALEARLRDRGTESEDKVRMRINNAVAEIAYADDAVRSRTPLFYNTRCCEKLHAPLL